MKKIVAISAVVLALGAGLFLMNSGDNTNPLAAQAVADAGGEEVTCGVSLLKNNPDQFLGNVNVTGRAGKVFTEDGVVELSDEKACCAIFLLVPTTQAQKDRLGTPNLYKGEMPAVGAPIEAQGVLEKTNEGYAFVVSRITSGGKVLIERI